MVVVDNIDKDLCLKDGIFGVANVFMQGGNNVIGNTISANMLKVQLGFNLIYLLLNMQYLSSILKSKWY